MKITVPVTFEINPQDWAAEYGYDTDAEAEKAIRWTLSLATGDSDRPDKRSELSQGIGRAWLAMDYLARITTGAPYNPDDVAAAVAGLVDTFGLDTVAEHIRTIRHQTAMSA